jgi:hypothetical protein
MQHDAYSAHEQCFRQSSRELTGIVMRGAGKLSAARASATAVAGWQGGVMSAFTTT